MTQAFTESNQNSNLFQSLSQQLCPLNHTNKKKMMFVRKPGPSFLLMPVEKHRKNISEHIDALQKQRGTYLQEQVEQNEPREEFKTIRTHRQTQNFKKQSIHQTSNTSIKQIVLSPSKSTSNLLLGLKYIQRPTEQINCQNIIFKSKYPVTCNSGLETQKTMNLDDTSDNSFKKESGNYQTFNKFQKKEEDNEFCSTSYQKLKNLLKIESKIQTLECIQCKNLNIINHFLTLKCVERQKQLQLRTEDLRFINQKLNILKKQKQTLKSKQEQLREELYMKEVQAYQECSSRYQNVRKQLNRVAQKVKYLQIENGVLFRYKQDCFEAKRDYQKIKQQNENLKKQISSISRMGQKYSSKRQNVEMTKKQLGVGKSAYFKMSKQQDTISLQFSQASYQHI